MKKTKNPPPLVGEWVKTSEAAKYLGLRSRTGAVLVMRASGVKRREVAGLRGRPAHEWSAADVGKLRLLRQRGDLGPLAKMTPAPKPEVPTSPPPRIEKPSGNGVPAADGSIVKVLLRIIEDLAEGRDSRLPGIARAVAVI